MCGIAGLHRRTDKPFPKMGKLADELLLGIADRGPDSTGFLAMLDTGLVQTEKAAVRATRFIEKRPRFSEEARSLLLHTRWATIGKVNALNAHPIISGRCAAVHNGTIWNADELFKTFDLGRKAEVDSEIIPALVDLAGWENADQAFELMRGGAATAVVNADHPRELILARTQSYPLIYLATKDWVVWASTERAIVSAWWMTFRKAPPKGEWGRMAEWSMLRVNGRMEYTRLTAPKPEPWKRTTVTTTKRRMARSVTVQAAVETAAAKTTPKPPTRKKATKAVKGTTAKRRRKAAKRQTATKAPVTRSKGTGGATPTADLRLPIYPLEREPWMEDMVTDLMLDDGASREEAEELVYGTSMTDELWRDMDDDLSRVLKDERGR